MKTSMRDIFLGESSQYDIADKNESLYIKELREKFSIGIKRVLDYENGENWTEIGIQTNNSAGDAYEKDYIKKRLRDFNATFPVFKEGLIFASNTVGEKKSVDLYIADINHPEFIQTIENISKDRKDIILDIKFNDHGLIGKTTIKNLEYCQYLGYNIGIHGFSTKNTNHDIRSTEIKDSDIIFTNLEKLFKADINPKYIKIPRFLYKILYSGEHRGKFTLAHTENILQEIKNRNCEVLISDGQGEYSDVSISSIETPEILKNSSIRQNELCLDINGNIQFIEALINFGDGISTPNGLQFLKERGITESLMSKVFNEAIFPGVLKGESKSINTYLKDIESDTFMEGILELANWLPSYAMRKKVIIELLEESYGTLNNTIITNLKKTKDLGFSIAIDDFCVSDNQIGISREILIALYENGINIDYLKIDGGHIMDIYNDTISPLDLAKLRQVIKLFKERGVIIVAESTQNKEHADLITRKIGCPGAKILFQGRYLNEGWK